MIMIIGNGNKSDPLNALTNCRPPAGQHIGWDRICSLTRLSITFILLPGSPKVFIASTSSFSKMTC